MKRLIVCGDRHYPYYRTILEALRRERDNIESVIEGEARGADILSRMACKSLGITCIKFPGDWEKFGLYAGSIRNSEMLEELLKWKGEKEIWAFHLNLSSSSGTKNMVGQGKKMGITCRLYEDKEGSWKIL